jgi:cell division protein FtsL
MKRKNTFEHLTRSEKIIVGLIALTLIAVMGLLIVLINQAKN